MASENNMTLFNSREKANLAIGQNIVPGRNKLNAHSSKL
jgi:hypothetical protein